MSRQTTNRQAQNQKSVEQNEKSSADRNWKSSEPRDSEQKRHDHFNLRPRHLREKKADHFDNSGLRADEINLSRPSDILTLEELKAFAVDVADFVEESRLNLMADRMLLDISRLDESSRTLSKKVQMRANQQSAGV